jgi:thiol-disulfide isomerase/thioredoxin
MRRNPCRRWTEAALLVFGFALFANVRADVETDAVDAALKLARDRHAPVLVDFYAPWCYSCYFMSKNVKNGPEWERLERRAVVVELDADAPDGAHFMKLWQVKGLPSYVVLDESGAELGRIPLERTRAQFYPEIDAILARGATLASLEESVTDGSPAAVAAARRVLAAFHARNDSTSGLDWLAVLPPEAMKAIGSDPETKLWAARLELQRAANNHDAEACAAAAPAVLAGELGCDRPYEVERTLDCTATLPAERRKALLASQRPLLAKLLAERVFIKLPACADARSTVEASIDLADVFGDAKGKASVLDRAIDDAQRRLGGVAKANPKRDRNIADNLRLYLELAGRLDVLGAWYPKLIAAYPDDYVYAFRFGRSLHERGRDAQALPWLEQAAGRAYGANRLNVALVRVATLQKLGRADDARRVAADALEANGPFFPELVAKLKAAIGAG